MMMTTKATGLEGLFAGAPQNDRTGHHPEWKVQTKIEESSPLYQEGIKGCVLGVGH